MKEHLINLTDGTKLAVNVNFGTLYWFQKAKVSEFVGLERELTDEEKIEQAARMIYAILRSNGRNVTFDESLILVPMDTKEIEKLFNEFKFKMENFKKKEKSKEYMRSRKLK